jgi:tetratricopeptide (TPR) repeat protein
VHCGSPEGDSETAPRLPDVAVARILSSLATLLADRGDLREADGLASRARKLYEQTHGPQHAELAEALITLAAVRASRGDLDEAQALLLRARRVAELENARPAVRASAVANLGALCMLIRPGCPASPSWPYWRNSAETTRARSHCTAKRSRARRTRSDRTTGRAESCSPGFRIPAAEEP